MRKQTLFQAREKHDRKLQALGVVHGQQRDLRSLVRRIGIGDQRCVIQKIRMLSPRSHGFDRRVHQFVRFSSRVSASAVFSSSSILR